MMTVVELDFETGSIVGTVESEVAHAEGVWHASSHVWILDSHDRLLFRQRSFGKDRHGGMWEASATGHVHPAVDLTCDVQTELGVTPTARDLIPVGRFRLEQRYGNKVNREQVKVDLWVSGHDIESFDMDHGDTIGLAAFRLRDLNRLIAGEPVVCHVWRGDCMKAETISASSLVPVPQLYWETLFAVLQSAIDAKEIDAPGVRLITWDDEVPEYI